jgi:hypothetical protein
MENHEPQIAEPDTAELHKAPEKPETKSAKPKKSKPKNDPPPGSLTEQEHYHRRSANWATGTMLSFLAVLLIGVVLRVWLELSGQVTVSEAKEALDRHARASRDLRRLQAEIAFINDDKLIDQMLRVGDPRAITSRAGSSSWLRDPSIAAKLGLEDGGDEAAAAQQALAIKYRWPTKELCSNNPQINVDFPPQVKKRIIERLPNEHVFAAVCPDTAAVLIAAQHVRTLVAQLNTSREKIPCDEELQAAVRGLAEATTDAPGITLDVSELIEEAPEPVASCMIKLGDVKNSLNYFGSVPTDEDMHKALSSPDEKGERYLADLKEQVGSASDAMAQAQAKINTRGRELNVTSGAFWMNFWLTMVFSIVALLGVQASYQQSRAHQYEIVEIQRSARSRSLLTELNASGLLEAGRKLATARPELNPFSPRLRAGRLETPQGDLIRAVVRDAVDSYVATVGGLVRRSDSGEKTSGGKRGNGRGGSARGQTGIDAGGPVTHV